MLPEFEYGSYILKNPKKHEKLCEELMSLDWSFPRKDFEDCVYKEFPEIRINIKGHEVTETGGLFWGSYDHHVYLCVNREPIDLIKYLEKVRKPPKCLKRL